MALREIALSQPVDWSLHTLAQLARRAGISEGRARGLATAVPSGLPRPDSTDADGRPLWRAATIDAWCARTGRKVSSDSLWLFRAPAASVPMPELQRGVVTLAGSHRRPTSFYTIVWDTEHGHVIYLQPLDDAGGAHKDWLAQAAAELIEPRWWADAVVVMPLEESLRVYGHDAQPPSAYVYRLTNRAQVASDDASSDDASEDVARPAGAFGGLRRWISGGSHEPDGSVGPAEAASQWEGQMDVAEIAAVVGCPIPVWLDDTATSANARQTLSYDRTFITADTVTEWPATQARLTRAVQAGTPGEFPAAFAALAVDAAEGLAAIRAAHERLADAGPGWYLVCRPARPAPPFELEQLITGAQLVTDPDLVGNELTELRTTEGDLDIEDPRGDVYAEAIDLLERQLHQAARKAGQKGDVPVADDTLRTYTSPWSGPVIEAWRETLTPVEDMAAALRLRRVRRLAPSAIEDLLANTDSSAIDDNVLQLYRDGHGRYVMVLAGQVEGEYRHSSEWPTGLQVTTHWTDKTVIAGDDDQGTTTTLLALTPTEDGRMRIDPVPLLPQHGTGTFAYGYGGGTPGTTYRALLRCALGHVPPLSAGPIRSGQLWTAISTTHGPLRLSWPQLKLWARADQKHAAKPERR